MHANISNIFQENTGTTTFVFKISFENNSRCIAWRNPCPFGNKLIYSENYDIRSAVKKFCYHQHKNLNAWFKYCIKFNMDNVPGIKNCPSGPCAYWTMVAPVAEVVDGLALVMVSVCRPWDTATPSELEICMVPAGKTTEESTNDVRIMCWLWIHYTCLHIYKEIQKWIKTHNNSLYLS